MTESLLSNTDELITRITVFALFPFLIAFSFIVFIFYRRSRENAIHRKQLELQLKAIRAQINPHFIFNCLNSIHYCIQSNESEKAGIYLLKFSYLTRRILENSSKQWITLEEDLDMMRAYLDLEQLRTAQRFQYQIEVSHDTDPKITSVPMLIIQPLLENAIWHGFASKQEGAKLTIEVFSDEDNVVYRIRDNGELTSSPKNQSLGKTQSLGLSLIHEQLDAIQELEKRETHLASSSIKNPAGEHIGTHSEIKIPYIPFY